MIENIKNWVLDVFYPDVVERLEHNKLMAEDIVSLQTKISNLDTKINTINLTKKELKENLKVVAVSFLTPIDDFLSKTYLEVPKFAYNNKRRYNGKLFPVYPNEMITPDSYYAVKLREELSPLSDNTRDRALVIGRRIDRGIRWVSDLETTGMDDFYHYIAESIIDGRSDCESQCFAVSSIDPDNFGVAFGNTQKDNKGTWHAWNVFVYNDELWVLETNSVANFPNGGNTWIRKVKDSNYTMDWIFTKHKTYRARGSTHFGTIAR